MPLLLYLPPSSCSEQSATNATRYVIHCILKGNVSKTESNEELCSVTVTPRKKTIIRFHPRYTSDNGFFVPFVWQKKDSVAAGIPLYPSNVIFPSSIRNSVRSSGSQDASVPPKSILIDWTSVLNSSRFCTNFRTYDCNLRYIHIRGCVPDNFTLVDALSLEHAQNNESMVMTCPLCKQKNTFKPETVYGELPPLLIIQLKRFEFSVREMLILSNGEVRKEKRFRRRKITDVVDFPLTGLDLSSYALGEDHVYDCVCVCNHWGTDENGHYYAYCRDYFDSSWYEYNDERVTPLSEENVVTGNAYLLFYRKRGCDDALADVVLREATSHQLVSSVKLSHSPSKWLVNGGEQDPYEEEEPNTPKKGFFGVESGRFQNYSPASNVGQVSSNAYVQDIQGYKTKVPTRMSKQGRMKDFQSLYKTNLLERFNGQIQQIPSESASLRTGEQLVKPDLESGLEGERESVWEEYRSLSCYIIVFVLVLLAALWIVCFH